MTVSAGGTILWTPSTDSFSMEHVEYAITNGNGQKDTLTFNIFVNDKSIIDVADQYANNNQAFTYKIPVYGPDTLNFGYSPLKTPPGMTVSLGGAISWIPQTDSAYVEHIEYVIVNDLGKKDTLLFNLFVNYPMTASIKPSPAKKNDLKQFDIVTIPPSGTIKFSLPPSVSHVSIYNINGRLVDKIAPTISNCTMVAIWSGISSSGSKVPTGRYFVKVSSNNHTSMVKPFLYIR
jgi:hypothetical protein